jgi:hypothetical protein
MRGRKTEHGPERWIRLLPHLGTHSGSGNSDYFSRSRWFRDRQIVFPQSVQVKFDGFADEFLRVFLGGACGNYPRQIGNVGTPTGRRLLVNDNIVFTLDPGRRRVRVLGQDKSMRRIRCATRALGYRLVTLKTNERAADAWPERRLFGRRTPRESSRVPCARFLRRLEHHACGFAAELAAVHFARSSHPSGHAEPVLGTTR